MAVINDRVEARHYERVPEGYRCNLCPHHCVIPIGSLYVNAMMSLPS